MPVHPIRDTDNVVEIGKCGSLTEDVARVMRRMVKPFDITKSKRCPYCSSTDINFDLIMQNWRCEVCGEIWEE